MEKGEAISGLTPMQVQCVVGLCCLKQNPGAVEVVLGDMVLDHSTGEERDVDVTVTLQDAPGVVRAFKGYEVTRRSRPLSVSAVEQLCIKLKDMAGVTHPAIVSGSGYSEQGIKKALSHGIELYTMERWTSAVKEDFAGFPDWDRSAENHVRFGDFDLLFWLPEGRRFFYVVPKGPDSFGVKDSTPLFSSDGAAHPHFPTAGVLETALMQRSTKVLFAQEPALTLRATFHKTVITGSTTVAVGPHWPHTHTLDVFGDGVFLRFDTGLVELTQVTISGFLQWQSKAMLPEYHVLRRVRDREIFAGAAVATAFDDDRLFGMIFSPDSPTTHVHLIRLTAEQKNIIKRLKLDMPKPAPGGTNWSSS